MQCRDNNSFLYGKCKKIDGKSKLKIIKSITMKETTLNSQFEDIINLFKLINRWRWRSTTLITQASSINFDD